MVVVSLWRRWSGFSSIVCACQPASARPLKTNQLPTWKSEYVGFGGSVARKRVVFRRSPNATWVIIAVPMLCQRLTPRSSTTRPLMAFGHRARNAVR